MGKLELWQERYGKNQKAYMGELSKMDLREALYKGTKEIVGVKNGRVRDAAHVRNVVAELVEAQVSSVIPQPKVSATRAENEEKAKIIEDFLRNELNRLQMEHLNDQDERTTPIQGGAFYLVEWDASKNTHITMGALSVSGLHPKKVIPQAGVYTDVEDMDYIFVTTPQTKGYIKKRYGVEVSQEGESEPGIKGADSTKSDDLVTQVMAYYRNQDGGIGLFTWVGDMVLEDLADYQQRQGAAGETVTTPITMGDGRVIAPMDAQGNPQALPYYKPNVYPVILRKNVSVFGQFLGDSDVDKIADQQETIKKLETKVIEKLFKGGSVLTTPKGVIFDKTDEELRTLPLDDASQKSMIDVYNLQPDVSGDMAYMALCYEEARQIVGITDSFQGRQDSSATSGVAKEFSARQSAGRLESKRAMKEAAYGRLFETMFKFALAYSDEPRTVVSTDNQGHTKYKHFNRYDFLEQDAAGEWYWDDQYLFSVDASASLANNRESLWQEARMNFQQGCYGDPSSLEALVVFWSRMEQLHYPGAGDTKTYMEGKLEETQAAQAAVAGGPGDPSGAPPMEPAAGMGAPPMEPAAGMGMPMMGGGLL